MVLVPLVILVDIYKSVTLKFKFCGVCVVVRVFSVFSKYRSAFNVRVKQYKNTWTALVLFIISRTAV